MNSERRIIAGFTLIEMIVAIAIAAVLLAVGIPALRDMTVSQRVRAAANGLYSDLAYARSEAIKRNTQVAVARATGGWTNGWSVLVAGNPIRTHEQLRDVSYAGAAIGTITYNPDGRSTLTTSASFNFSSTTGGAVSMRCVVITPSGRPAVLTDSNRDGNCVNG